MEHAAMRIKKQPGRALPPRKEASHSSPASDRHPGPTGSDKLPGPRWFIMPFMLDPLTQTSVIQLVFSLGTARALKAHHEMSETDSAPGYGSSS